MLQVLWHLSYFDLVSKTLQKENGKEQILYADVFSYRIQILSQNFLERGF